MKRKLFLFGLLSLTLSLSACGGKIIISGTSSSNFIGGGHTIEQSIFLKDSLDNFAKYATGTKELSFPEPHKLSFENSDAKPGDIFEVKISPNRDMTDAKTYGVTYQSSCEFEFYNLLLGTTYYYEQKNITANDGFSLRGDFKTLNTPPRNLYIDGVTNARDCGGWQTTDGKVLNQGLVYRSGRFNKDKADEITITTAGRQVMIEDLKIKTEIDLRQDEIRTTSALGDSVKYINIPMSGTTVYKDFTALAEETKQVFSVLADKNNYPVVIHCSVGTDRTGLMCFLLNGLCGVSENDLYYDYMFSNFGQIKGMRKLNEITDSYVAELKKLPGNNLQEQIRYYLKSIGLSDNDLDAIISIMTE